MLGSSFKLWLAHFVLQIIASNDHTILKHIVEFNAVPRLNVFVACPYLLFPLEDYKRCFDAVGRAYEVSFKFADEQITNQHVLKKITDYIRDHDFSLFDITGWNPNVSLELGIAVGLGKRYFILLNHRLDQNKDVPSDIKGIDRIQYSSKSELETKLILLIKQELPSRESRADSAFITIKAQVLEALRSNPGSGVSKPAVLIREDKTLVQSTVRVMSQSGELKTAGAKRGMVYYTPDTDLRTIRRI